MLGVVPRKQALKWNFGVGSPTGQLVRRTPSLVVGRSNGPRHVLAVQLNVYQWSAWGGILMEGNILMEGSILMGVVSQTLRGSGEVVMLEKEPKG